MDYECCAHVLLFLDNISIMTLATLMDCLLLYQTSPHAEKWNEAQHAVTVDGFNKISVCAAAARLEQNSTRYFNFGKRDLNPSEHSVS